MLNEVRVHFHGNLNLDFLAGTRADAPESFLSIDFAGYDTVYP